MIVVDSSVWIDYFNGKATPQTDTLHQLLGAEPILVGDLILTEILQGFRTQRQFNTARRALDALFFAPMVGRDIALKSAQNYRALKAKGFTVRKTIDVLIATFCIENGHTLLQADRDFDVLEAHLGLQVVATTAGN